jgi:hypothetical protein
MKGQARRVRTRSRNVLRDQGEPLNLASAVPRLDMPNAVREQDFTGSSWRAVAAAPAFRLASGTDRVRGRRR